VIDLEQNTSGDAENRVQARFRGTAGWRFFLWGAFETRLVYPFLGDGVPHSRCSLSSYLPHGDFLEPASAALASSLPFDFCGFESF